MPRYFVETEKIADNKIIIEGDDARHISVVLRGKVGDEIEVCDSQSREYVCTIKEMEKDKIILKIEKARLSDSEAKTKITLFQGLPKSDKMEMIIQKCVELGVFKIVPVSTERAVVKLNKKDGVKKTQRWQKISEAAAKQSGRGIIPEVLEPVSFKEGISLAKKLDGAIIPYENEEKTGLREFVTSFKGGEIGVFIGPEGGFSQGEIQLAKENGILPISLGKRILRTETAGMTTLAILLYELG